MKAFIIALFTALALDLVWIGALMNGFYKSQLGALMRVKPSGDMDPILWAAGMVYILIPLGVVLFVLPKFAAGSGLAQVAAWGFVYGVILYGVYDLTNYSLLNHWTLQMTLVDMVWGGVLCAITSTVTHYFTRT